MADFTTISTSRLLPDAPARSIDAIALRDNPVAIAEGAAGAPRIRTVALQPPVAGDTYLINRLQDAEADTSNANYPNEHFHRYYSYSQHIGVLVLVAGSIRCKAEHRRTASGSNSTLRILKNGVQEIEWTADPINTWYSRSYDLDVNVGDIVIFQQKGGSAASRWRNLRIYSDNPDMAVS